jgi:hypothetical protein
MMIGEKDARIIQLQRGDSVSLSKGDGLDPNHMVRPAAEGEQLPRNVRVNRSREASP